MSAADSNIVEVISFCPNISDINLFFINPGPVCLTELQKLKNKLAIVFAASEDISGAFAQSFSQHAQRCMFRKEILKTCVNKYLHSLFIKCIENQSAKAFLPPHQKIKQLIIIN